MPVTALVTPGPEVTSATPTLPRRARIAVGRVHRALLVAHQHVLDLVLLEELVVDVEDRAARIAEDVLDALLLEAADQDFRTRQLHESMPRAVNVPVTPVGRERRRNPEVVNCRSHSRGARARQGSIG